MIIFLMNNLNLILLVGIYIFIIDNIVISLRNIKDNKNS